MDTRTITRLTEAVDAAKSTQKILADKADSTGKFRMEDLILLRGILALGKPGFKLLYEASHSELEVSEETMEPAASQEGHYKNLFEQAIYHLRCVSGSRNSFTQEMSTKMHSGRPVALRTPGVDALHRNATDFLALHDK